MKKAVSKKAKRRLFLSCTVLIGVIVMLIATTYNDWAQILNNSKQIKDLDTKYVTLLGQEASLESEVAKFQDPNYVARYAREKFLYSLPGELIIRLPKK